MSCVPFSFPQYLRRNDGRAYGPIFVLSVLIPLFGTALAISLFKFVPTWGLM